MRNELKFDISNMPFSRFGSYFAISRLQEKKDIPAGIWIRNVHGDAAREVFLIAAVENGETVPVKIITSASELILSTEKGRVRICLSDLNQIRVLGEGTGFRLTARPGNYNSAIPQPNNVWLLNIATAFQNYLLTPLQGSFSVDCPWEVARCTHVKINVQPDSEIVIDQGVGTWQPAAITTTFNEDSAAVAKEFASFVDKYHEENKEFAETTALAAYLNWSTVVEPCGLLTRPAMLMSKNHMTNVWSWDHAFNALALAAGHPQLAWDQLMLQFDHQLPSGQLPDFLNDIIKLYNFVKPPIHGWIFRRMQQANPWFQQQSIISEFYEKLCNWTDWWFAYRNPDGDGLPQYHHGNDSGWDNGTVFDIGLPVNGADLSALLVLQMEMLSEMAVSLNLKEDAVKWQQRAEKQLNLLISRCWNGEKFINPSAINGKITEKSDSIFSCLPILLGNHLPVEIQQALVKQVHRHLTNWGLATENPASPLYEPDGYWRGPIWAPPTLMITDGLYQIGEKELAAEIVNKFSLLCKKEGFAENYDAINGTALRDKAYTWTSSVYLVLRKMLREN